MEYYYIGQTYFDRTIGEVKDDLNKSLNLERDSMRFRIKNDRFRFLEDTNALSYYKSYYNDLSPLIYVLDGKIIFTINIQADCSKDGNEKLFDMGTNPVRTTLEDIKIKLQEHDPFSDNAKVIVVFRNKSYSLDKYKDTSLESMGVEHGDTIYIKKNK